MSVFNRMLNGSRGCTELLTCVYDLNRLEARAYVTLLDHQGANMEELAEALGRERSTVHRAVQKLLNLQLVEREPIPLDGGGYFYMYTATQPEQVRSLIETRLETFEQVVREALDTFEEELGERAASAPAEPARTR